MDQNKYFENRYSVRKYNLEKHIDDVLLNEILSQAAQAPNTGNMQLYSVVVTRSQEGKDRLAPAHFNQPAVTGCDVLLTVCADVNRYNSWCRVNGVDPGTDNFEAFIYSAIDAVIYAQQVCTIAEMSGIGTCYMGTTTYNTRQIAESLALPKGVVPIVTLTLGYPGEEGKPSDRLPLEAIVHNESYKNYSDSDIMRLYELKESIPENKEYVKANLKNNLASVFAEIRYRRSDNEYFSKQLIDFLESAGFNLSSAAETK